MTEAIPPEVQQRNLSKENIRGRENYWRRAIQWNDEERLVLSNEAFFPKFTGEWIYDSWRRVEVKEERTYEGDVCRFLVVECSLKAILEQEREMRRRLNLKEATLIKARGFEEKKIRSLEQYYLDRTCNKDTTFKLVFLLKKDDELGFADELRKAGGDEAEVAKVSAFLAGKINEAQGAAVFEHGWTGQAEVWGYQRPLREPDGKGGFIRGDNYVVDILRRTKGFYGLVLDGLGSNRTADVEKLKGKGFVYTPEDEAQHILTVFDLLGLWGKEIRYHGHSFGGSAGFFIAQKITERLFKIGALREEEGKIIVENESQIPDILFYLYAPAINCGQGGIRENSNIFLTGLTDLPLDLVNSLIRPDTQIRTTIAGDIWSLVANQLTPAFLSKFLPVTYKKAEWLAKMHLDNYQSKDQVKKFVLRATTIGLLLQPPLNWRYINWWTDRILVIHSALDNMVSCRKVVQELKKAPNIPFLEVNARPSGVLKDLKEEDLIPDHYDFLEPRIREFLFALTMVREELFPKGIIDFLTLELGREDYNKIYRLLCTSPLFNAIKEAMRKVFETVFTDKTGNLKEKLGEIKGVEVLSYMVQSIKWTGLYWPSGVPRVDSDGSPVAFERLRRSIIEYWQKKYQKPPELIKWAKHI